MIRLEKLQTEMLKGTLGSKTYLIAFLYWTAAEYHKLVIHQKANIYIQQLFFDNNDSWHKEEHHCWSAVMMNLWFLKTELYLVAWLYDFIYKDTTCKRYRSFIFKTIVPYFLEQKPLLLFFSRTSFCSLH